MELYLILILYNKLLLYLLLLIFSLKIVVGIISKFLPYILSVYTLSLYSEGDIFAIVTDGLTDQIGGASGKTSYGYRRLEEVLKANCAASAEEITAAMKSDFAAWQGTNARRDDVTAVVFRL